MDKNDVTMPVSHVHVIYNTGIEYTTFGNNGEMSDQCLFSPSS